MLILWEGSLRDINKFAFSIVDIDHDGILGGPDLLTVQENVDIYSTYGQEILGLVDHYVSTHLMTKTRVNPKHFLHLDTYTSLLNDQKSCIIEELKLKILSKEGKHKDKSVLFRDKTLDKAGGDLRGRRNAANNRQRQQVKRAILMWTGGNALKEKKKVTFGYIPAYKDEDDDNYGRYSSRRKLAKDLPTVGIKIQEEDND